MKTIRSKERENGIDNEPKQIYTHAQRTHTMRKREAAAAKKNLYQI